MFNSEPVPWTGLYSLKFLRKNKILLNESLGASYQDNGLFCQSLMLSHRIYVYNKSYYRLRRDNELSSVYDKKKVFAIHNEYDFIYSIFEKNKELSPKFAFVIACIRYRHCFWKLGVTAEEFKLDSLKRLSDDFSKIEERGELLSNLFTDKEWEDLQTIIKSPETYYYNNSEITYNFIRCLPPNKYPEVLKRWFLGKTGKELNLDNPKNFNEKMQWLKLYDNIELKTKLTDKYSFREYIKEKIGEKHLIPLLDIVNQFNEIDFDTISENFVIKTNHSEDNKFIVKDREIENLEKIKDELELSLKENYAIKNGLELHYGDIKPKIIIEKYISELDNKNNLSYNFFCFNGVPKYIWVENNNKDKSIFDLNWNFQNIKFNDYQEITPIPQKPENFDEMLNFAKTLCQNFIFVKIKFYSVNGEIYCDKMDFCPQSGIYQWSSEEDNLEYGNLIELPLNNEKKLPEKSFAERGIEELPVKFVPPYIEDENSQLKIELNNIKNGYSFRIGRIITYIPRKARDTIRCYKEKGLKYTIRRIIEQFGIDMGTGNFRK